MAKRQTQLNFELSGLAKPTDAFGGSLLKGNPKCRRPLASNLPVLLTLRAANSVLRIPKTYKKVNETVFSTAQKYGVKIYQYSNVGNHLHILLKLPNLRAWAAFIRELTGKIAQAVLALLQSTAIGLAKASSKGFWKFRPHTRIVRGWRRAFGIAKEYVKLNILEAEGMIRRSETKTLKDLRAIWSG